MWSPSLGPAWLNSTKPNPPTASLQRVSAELPGVWSAGISSGNMVQSVLTCCLLLFQKLLVHQGQYSCLCKGGSSSSWLFVSQHWDTLHQFSRLLPLPLGVTVVKKGTWDFPSNPRCTPFKTPIMLIIIPRVQISCLLITQRYSYYKISKIVDELKSEKHNQITSEFGKHLLDWQAKYFLCTSELFN